MFTYEVSEIWPNVQDVKLLKIWHWKSFFLIPRPYCILNYVASFSPHRYRYKCNLIFEYMSMKKISLLNIHSSSINLCFHFKLTEKSNNRLSLPLARRPTWLCWHGTRCSHKYLRVFAAICSHSRRKIRCMCPFSCKHFLKLKQHKLWEHTTALFSCLFSMYVIK